MTVQRGPTHGRAEQATTARPSRSRPTSRSTWPPRCATRAPRSSSRTCRSAPRTPSATTPRPPWTPACAFVNAIPVFIASDPVWARKFRDARVPIIGDDIKSQVGATIVHRVLARLFEDRGLSLDHTYQLNVGGNMDFKNMLDRERLESKKVSKTQAVTSQLEVEPPRRRRRAHRPERPRAVAARPQVGLHPHGGPQLRRRAPQRRAQARGLGLAQLRRGHHRRGALREGGPRPRHRRAAARPDARTS